MTPEAMFIAILGPASGLMIAWIANRRSKRQVDREQSVAVQTVQVSEKEAHTREIAMILDGYTKVNMALNATLDRTNTGLKDCSDKYDALEKRFDAVERENKLRMNVIEDHVTKLEKMVPSPPGPPPRPF